MRSASDIGVGEYTERSLTLYTLQMIKNNRWPHHLFSRNFTSSPVPFIGIKWIVCKINCYKVSSSKALSTVQPITPSYLQSVFSGPRWNPLSSFSLLLDAPSLWKPQTCIPPLWSWQFQEFHICSTWRINDWHFSPGMFLTSSCAVAFASTPFSLHPNLI